MTFDGAHGFFGFLKWTGWVVFAIAIGMLLYAYFGRGGTISRIMAFSTLGSGISMTAFGIIGQMVASIATSLQAMNEREAAKDRYRQA